MSSPSPDAAAKTQSIYGSRKASLILDILVVGGGIGGLCAAFCLTQAGHRVTVIESSPVMGPAVGAGISIPRNSSRLLLRWGLGKRLDEVAFRPQGVTVRKYSTGERLGFTKVAETAGGHSGTPQYQIHRADLHKLLYDLVSSDVTILLDSPVVGCNPDPVVPSVTLKSGKVLKADLIIGADGLKSYIQQVVLGKFSRAEPTGNAAYRILIPTSLMMQDPELRELIEPLQATSWLGPGRCMVAYPISRGEVYNLVLFHPDDGSVESWTAGGNVDETRRGPDNPEPRVRKMLGMIQPNMKFRLMDRKPLDKWVHDSGRLVLLGDACHPMLPYRAQGAAMAVEDAAALGNLLSRISHISQLGPLLKAYQDLRLPRTSMAQESSRALKRVFCLPDGPEQRERDERLKSTTLKLSDTTSELRRQRDGKQNPGEKEDHDPLLSYDVDYEVDKWWASHGSELEALGRSKLLGLTSSEAAFICVACVCVCLLALFPRR